MPATQWHSPIPLTVLQIKWRSITQTLKEILSTHSSTVKQLECVRRRRFCLHFVIAVLFISMMRFKSYFVYGICFVMRIKFNYLANNLWNEFNSVARYFSWPKKIKMKANQQRKFGRDSVYIYFSIFVGTRIFLSYFIAKSIRPSTEFIDHNPKILSTGLLESFHCVSLSKNSDEH